LRHSYYYYYYFFVRVVNTTGENEKHNFLGEWEGGGRRSEKVLSTPTESRYHITDFDVRHSVIWNSYLIGVLVKRFVNVYSSDRCSRNVVCRYRVEPSSENERRSHRIRCLRLRYHRRGVLRFRHRALADMHQ